MNWRDAATRFGTGVQNTFFRFINSGEKGIQHIRESNGLFTIHSAKAAGYLALAAAELIPGFGQIIVSPLDRIFSAILKPRNSSRGDAFKMLGNNGSLQTEPFQGRQTKDDQQNQQLENIQESSPNSCVVSLPHM